MSPSPPPTGRGPTLIQLTGAGYFPLALIARLPFAMMVVGVLTLVVSARGSIELGGLSSAMVGIGSAIIGPLVGAAADRFGQRSALLATATLNSASLTVLAGMAYSDLPIWSLFAAAFVVGASGPQISPMSRSRLVMIIQHALPVERRPRTMSTTLAYESAADEVVFVFGPVLVGVLATAFGAWAPIVGAAALTLVFVIAFAFHHTSAPPASHEERSVTLAPAVELLRPALIVVVVGIFGVGLVFGSTLTALTGFMQLEGSPERAGLLYGVMGVGSAILAISVAWFSPRFTLRYRWIIFAALVLAGEVVFGIATTVTGITLGLALTGFGIGPLLVTLYSFGAARSPAGRSATVMTMLGSGVVLGQSAAAALTGFVAEGTGVPAALLVPMGAAAVTVLAGVANWGLTPSGRFPGARASRIDV